MPLYRVFARKIFEIYGSSAPKKLGVALSGGVDSIALTSVASKWAKMSNIDLHAYIIDHGLREESSEEASNVQKYVADKFGVQCSVDKLVNTAVPGGRLEEWARDARRSAFYRMCKKDGINSLLMAHHFDDQRELFVQRLLAGSQWMGLAGMRQRTPMYTVLPTIPSKHGHINLMRPFIDVPKSSLIEHCEKEHLMWWEDPTNQRADYTQRNLIRKYFAVTPIAQQPKCVQPTSTHETLNFLYEKRRLVLENTSLIYNQLKASKRLMFDRTRATASLELSIPELEQTPTAILTELLYRIAVPISPASPAALGHARYKLRSIAESLQQKKSFVANSILVNFQFDNGKLYMCREQPRRLQLENVVVYKASSEWSKWVSLDNRWSFRWKLPQLEESSHIKKEMMNDRVYFDVRFVKDPTPVMKLLVPNQDKLNQKQRAELRSQMKLHPMLKWTDPQIVDAVDSDKVIGFPTLGLVRGLEVECVPKECMF